MEEKKPWKTRISQVVPGKCIIRGYRHNEIIENLSYAEGLFLTLKGRLPTPNEGKMVDALLNALLDHQFESVTVATGRHIVSGNPQFVPGVAGALLAVGMNTTSPQDSAEVINRYYEIMKKENLTIEETARRAVDDFQKAKKRIPGFGHPLHKENDYRAESLKKVAERLGIIGERTRLYEAIHKEFLRRTGKKGIPINVDGMMASIMNEMGFEPMEMIGVAILSVLPGIMAHVIEEIKDWKGLRYPSYETTEYIGEPEQGLPVERTKG